MLRESCFNPRTREGATEGFAFSFAVKNVSIHAPVRVRLWASWEGLVNVEVSIHAPVRVRRRTEPFPWAVNGFNPRTREGATRL